MSGGPGGWWSAADTGIMDGRREFRRDFFLDDGRLQTTMSDGVKVVVKFRAEVSGGAPLAGPTAHRHVAQTGASTALR